MLSWEYQNKTTEEKSWHLGPAGTYTEEACGVFFEKQGSYLPYETVQAAVQALAEGETVYSHKQGIAQGKDWLAEHLPEAEVVEVSSTAEGARMVSEGGDASCAAIASAGCANVYGLEILAAGIQNNENNRTRFYVLSLDPPATAKSDRLAFIANGQAEELPELVAAMEKQNITLVALHDRPLKTELGEYHYLIECAGCSYESYQKLTKTGGFSFRYLGSFSVR